MRKIVIGYSLKKKREKWPFLAKFFLCLLLSSPKETRHLLSRISWLLEKLDIFLKEKKSIYSNSGWHDHSVIVFQNQVISMYKSIPDSRFSASWEGKKLKLWLSTSLAYLLSYVIYGSVPESSLLYVWVYSRFKNLS